MSCAGTAVTRGPNLCQSIGLAPCCGSVLAVCRRACRLQRGRGFELATDPEETDPILVNDIGERNAAGWPEPAHWITNRQQGIRVGVRRQSACRLRFRLEH